MPDLQKIPPERIAELAERVEYVPSRVLNTTSTVVHAFLDGRFHLASGHSACLNPDDFDAVLGTEIATKRCRAAVMDKLWEMEGYRAYVNAFETAADVN